MPCISSPVRKILPAAYTAATEVTPASTTERTICQTGGPGGSMTAGEFLTFNTAVTMLLTSVTQLTGLLVSAAAVLPMFEQIKPVLDEAPEVRGASAQPGALSGGIEARKLSFRYTDDGNGYAVDEAAG